MPDSQYTLKVKKKIYFKGPFNKWTVSNLEFVNDSNHDILYKVKSNNKEKFMIEPKSTGVLHPQEKQTIHLLLSPLEGGAMNPGQVFKVLLETAYPADKTVREMAMNPGEYWKDPKPYHTKHVNLQFEVGLDAPKFFRKDEDMEVLLT